MTARLALQTSTLRDLTEEYPKGKLATTETRHCFTAGSFRVTLAFGASDPERLTTFVPAKTTTAVVGKARPFTIVSAAPGRGCSRSRAEEFLRGAGATAGEASDAADGGFGVVGLSPVTAGRRAGGASLEGT